MEQSKQQRIRELTDRLNRCRYEYYNLNAPSLTDAEYDALFDELSMLEKETGFSMTNSPTQTVGCYPAVSALVKTAHPIPLLSLDKTKSSAELLRFAGEQMVMLMLKLDGLTVPALSTTAGIGSSRSPMPRAMRPHSPMIWQAMSRARPMPRAL